MPRVIYILIFLFISFHGLSQNDSSSQTKRHTVDSTQHADLQFYCDNEIEARFPGGLKAWGKFVAKNFRMSVPGKNHAPKGTYKLMVTFWINKDGKVFNAKIETNVGYGVDQEVIRVIEHCPKWISATNCGKKISSAKRQPVTIIVT